MKKTLIILAITIVAMPALALPKIGSLKGAEAGLPPEAVRHHLRGIVQTVMRHALNFRQETPLTSEQREKIGIVLTKHREEVRSLMQRGKEARFGFEEVARTSGPDSAATREAAEKLADIARDRALMTARIGSEMRPLLTEGQQKSLANARAEIHDLVDAAMAKKNL